MGNSASNQRHSSASASAGSTSTTVICYYELLGVELSATPEEIKKAYRSKALQLHPDKNMHRVQEATEMFAKIQNAYQVLSDPQERAFYDRHRESILRKGKGNRAAESGYSVDDLMNFFDSSIFKGYGDDPKGFYAVYRNLFAFLEDLEAEESDNPSRYTFTSFGSKNTPFEPSLKVFYDKFLHFSSIRPFYEADNYDDNYAENRRHRRAIGKENQKFRDAMRREYNDTVRNLAAWVRKRDPRWQTYQKERAAQRQEAEARRKEENVRRRAEMAENYVAPDWAINDQCIDDEEFLLQQLERLQFEALGSDQTNPVDSDSEAESEEFDDFYCVVCKKVFKNHKQWKNHEQSKKHRVNMIKAGFDPEEQAEEEGEEEYEEYEHIEPTESIESIESESESTESESAESESNESESESEPESEPDTELEIISHQKTASDDEIGKQKPPKKKIRQRSKPVQESKPAKSGKSKEKPKNSAASDLKCSVCGETFDSRNKLFKHIEATGHAALKTGNKKKKK